VPTSWHSLGSGSALSPWLLSTRFDPPMSGGYSKDAEGFCPSGRRDGGRGCGLKRANTGVRPYRGLVRAATATCMLSLTAAGPNISMIHSITMYASQEILL
jgi:hypothetical protein